MSSTKYEPVIELRQNEEQEDTTAPEPAQNTLTNKFIRLLQALEGKLMILISGSLTVICASFIKKASAVPVGEFCIIMFSSALTILIPAALFALDNPTSLHGKAKYIIPRVVIGSVTGVLCLIAYRKMEIGDVQALISPVAVFAAIFSRLLWGEKISGFTILSLIFSLTGVVLILKPTFIFGAPEVTKPYHPLFPLIPFSSCVVLGLAYCFMRKVGANTVSTLTISTISSLLFVVNGAILQLVFKDPFVLPGCTESRFYLVCVGVGMAVSLILLNRGLLLEKSGPGVLLRNFDIVTAYGIQVMVYSEPLEMLSVGGAILIILSVVIVTLDRLFFNKITGCNYQI
eukprot:sb/3466364/